jgi:hypothetical protein
MGTVKIKTGYHQEWESLQKFKITNLQWALGPFMGHVVT